MITNLLAVILGTFFGFSLYYIGATNHNKIKDMLKLKNLELAKIILSAIGLSSIMIAILNIFNLFDVTHFSIKSMHLGVILGGIIFGIGFALIGSCPGTLLAGLFIDINRNSVVIIGGLIGAFTFTLLYPLFKKLKIFDIFYSKSTLFNISNKAESLFDIRYLGLLLFGIILVVVGYFLPKKLIEKN